MSDYNFIHFDFLFLPLDQVSGSTAIGWSKGGGGRAPPEPNSFTFMQFSGKIWQNKKVLLRDRKRHTARRVASAPYASDGGGTLSSHGWGVPHPVMGVPHPVIVGGGGYPIQSLGGIPHHHPDLARGYPRYPPPSRPGMGYPSSDLGWGTPLPSRPGMGYPPHHPDLGWGTPPPTIRPGTGYSPPHRCWTDRHSQV